MSKNEFNTTLRIGKIGEARVFPVTMGKECWRYVYGGCCDRWHDSTPTIGKVDMDNIVKLNCAGCPKLKEGDPIEIVQLHEVKTNVATCDYSINGKSHHTQKLFIELIQNLGHYETGKFVKDKDTLCIDGILKYRDGIGWYKKREHAYNLGETKFDKADWYHFYQPYNIWESLKIERIKGEKQFVSARKDEVRKWLDDETIPDNSFMLCESRVELCISIHRTTLKYLVEEIERNVNRNNTWILNGNFMAYLIPIKDVIPCKMLSTKLQYPMFIGKDRKPHIDERDVQRFENMQTQGIEGVRVSLVGTYIPHTRDRNDIRATKAILPWTDHHYYIPHRLLDSSYDDGNKNEILLRPYDMFEHCYSGERYVPNAIWEFEGMRLIPYS